MSENTTATHDAPREVHPTSARPYYIIFAWLMALLIVTVLVSRFPFVKWGIGPVGIVIALAIATAKAVMVALYFMHVKGSSPLTKVFVIAGLAWLVILFALTLADYTTRGWLPVSEGWFKSPPTPAPTH